MRDRARRLAEARVFQRTILVVILVNAVTLGAETAPGLETGFGPLLHAIDRTALAVFVAELVLKLVAYRWAFFKDPWNCFDFAVVGIALVPASGPLSVLRALRILRALRLISIVPSMRKVVNTLLSAIPGMASIVGLLVLVLYVAGVMATKLFGPTAPEHFGDLGTSLWTLFQIMTGEAWPDIAREVMAEQPGAWLFFLVYILVSTFVMLNLFLAVMVSAAERVAEEDVAEQRQDRLEERERERATEQLILTELTALRREVEALRAQRSESEPEASGATPPLAR
ncbi:MAG TPA: ion transporter [Actinopolymorphaceae bacterium]